MSIRPIARKLLAAVLALGILGCATPPSEPAPAAQRVADSYDVVLLPTDDFSFEFAAELAKILASDTGLKVRAVLNLGTRDWSPYSSAPQYDPARLKDIAQPAIAQLKKSYGGAVYILLTSRDINSQSGNLRFLFAESYPQEKISVISAARMLIGPSGAQASAQLAGERLRKMTLRTIGFLYYDLPRSADPRDLLYSPLMSLDALDTLQPVLKSAGRPAQQQR